MSEMWVSDDGSYSQPPREESMRFMQFDTMIQILIVGLIVERFTEIIVDSKIAEPLRKAISKWAAVDPRYIDPDKPPPKSIVFKEYLSYFVKCGYCMSVWVSAACSTLFSVQMYQSESFYLMLLVNFVCSTLLYHGLANWIHVLFKRTQVGKVDVKDLKVTLEDMRDVSR